MGKRIDARLKWVFRVRPRSCQDCSLSYRLMAGRLRIHLPAGSTRHAPRQRRPEHLPVQYRRSDSQGHPHRTTEWPQNLCRGARSEAERVVTAEDDGATSEETRGVPLI